MTKVPVVRLILILVAALFIWNQDAPSGVDPRGMPLLALFLVTIAGSILKLFASGTLCLFSLTLLSIMGVLTFEQAFAGFSNPVVWLIVAAFFIARGMVVTGLGLRMANHLISRTGSHLKGIAYGLIATDLLLATAIPSVTARIGGILYPVVVSVDRAFQKGLHRRKEKAGGYLIQTIFQSGSISSAMFLTAMAGNPLIVRQVTQYGVSISWTSWALAALVPGILSLVLLPWVLEWIHPTEIKETEEIQKSCQEELHAMGKISVKEYLMLSIFTLLLFLWSFGHHWISATLTALLGLLLLLFSQVLSWEDVLKEKGAWDTFVWFATILTLSDYLTQFGWPAWLGSFVRSYFLGFSWQVALFFLSLFYFYIHYFFASNLAHIGAFFLPVFVMAVHIGSPPLLTTYILGFSSSLFGSLTHYGSGPAPILYSGGFVPLREWWKIGFFVSLMNLVIWGGVGLLWWKWLALF